MRLGFYRAIFFLRVVWPWIDVRYISPDLGNVLEAYKKIFRRLKKFWGRLEVDWSTSVHPTTQNITLKTVILESIFDFSMGLGFYRAIFFLCVVWPWIDVRYIPPDLGNVLETHKTQLPAQTQIRNAHVKTLMCLKFLVFFHETRFLPRHFFSYVSYDHESMCAIFPRT